VADRHVDVLLVGGGPASASCAQELRAAGYAGSVLLCGRELDPPYERPPISKGLLTGATERESTFLPVPGDVEVLTRTSVMKLDTAEKVATLSTKETVSFEHALVATGANVRRLPIDGSDLDGIHYLRALRNAEALRADVEGARQVVLIGGSFIACEVAASLTSIGIACTMVFPEEQPMAGVLGTAVGTAVRALLEGRGVTVESGDSVVRLEGEERVARVVTDTGRSFDCDAVVIGCGAMPDVMLARSSGLELGQGGGVLCSARLETSAPGIYAAGDMCEYDSARHGGPVRIEHHEVAVGQGRTVARNVVGRSEIYDDVPYFWSDLADWATIESIGAPAPGWDEDVVRGSLDAAMDFTVFHVRDGRVVGATTAGRPGDLKEAEALIRSGEQVSADALATA
jgi:3-phenylpropionate/trans-cinnamate dioxygenase ferredoxin reductase subunit